MKLRRFWAGLSLSSTLDLSQQAKSVLLVVAVASGGSGGGAKLMVVAVISRARGEEVMGRELRPKCGGAGFAANFP